MYIPDFPMTAFKINGFDGNIKLSIEQVWGFPESTAYYGGYDAKGVLKIKSGAYSATSDYHFTTGELSDFLEQLRTCYDSLSGTAVLANHEDENLIKCEFLKNGHITVSGEYQSAVHKKNRLTFEFDTDQTQILETIDYLERVYKFFGGSTGKRSE